LLELSNPTGQSQSNLIVLNQYFHSGLNRAGCSAQAVVTNVTVCMMKDVRVLLASVCVYLVGQVGLHIHVYNYGLINRTQQWSKV